MIYLSNSNFTNQEDIQYFFNAFDSSKLNFLEKYCTTLNYNIQNGNFNYNNKTEEENPEYINRKVYSINHIPEELNGFQEELENYIKIANKTYNFSLDYILDLAYIETYEGKHPLDWHTDIGSRYPWNKRKLSFSIIVNDPKEYEGGILEINNGSGNGIIVPPNNKGSLIFFPSFMLHRVTTVTKGVRKSIVGFIGGEPYR
jgi:uncharacterized FlaG/YvyC family protein